MKKIFFCMILLASASIKAKSFSIVLPTGWTQVTSGKCVSSDDYNVTGAMITLSGGSNIQNYTFGEVVSVADDKNIVNFSFPCVKSAGKNFGGLSAYSSMDIDVSNNDLYRVDLSSCFDTVGDCKPGFLVTGTVNKCNCSNITLTKGLPMGTTRVGTRKTAKRR